MNTLIPVPLLLLGLLALGAARLPAAETFSYQNPISGGLDPRGVRDCQIFREAGRWYMVPTAWPHWPWQEKNGILNPGVTLYSSANLLDWKLEGVLVPNPPADRWYAKRFWAPEVHRINGKYYATFNCSNPENGYPGQHFGYAVADSLRGPYRVVTEEKPLGTGNDFTLFQDGDGKVWGFWSSRDRSFGIGFAEMDLERGVFRTEPKSAILPGKIDYEKDANGDTVIISGYLGRPEPKIQRSHEWDSVGIEGPSVVKRDGRYLLFYSSWTRGYEIGFASADRITGPWKKHDANPFYGGQSEATCAKHRIEYSGDSANPFGQVGHNSTFIGPDGRLWLSCHGILTAKGSSPLLVIDPIDFDRQGNPVKTTPSHIRQTVTLFPGGHAGVD
jgi:xylan 1,4-beta-xylosidase